MAFKCVICGKNPGLLGSMLDNKNGWLCNDCFKAAGGMKTWMYVKKAPVGEIRERIELNKGGQVQSGTTGTQTDVFIPTRTVAEYIHVDEKNKKVRFPQVTTKNALNNLLGKESEIIYDFSDILSFELIENDNSVTSGGLGSAIVGGALFGAAGAVTGAVVGPKKTVGVCKNMRIKVTLKNASKPMVMIDFVQSPVKTNTSQYEKAQENAHNVLSLLQIICNSQEKNTSGATPSSNADEIMKYKELLDAGAITQEEYEAKKKQLLGL